MKYLNRSILGVAFTTFLITSSCVTTPDSEQDSDTLILPPRGDLTVINEKNFKNWFTYYYMDPRPDLTPGYLSFMGESGIIRQQPEMMMIFLSQVFAANSNHLESWQPAWRSYDQYDAYVIWAALLLSKSKEGVAIANDALASANPMDQKIFVKFMEEIAFQGDDISGMLTRPRYINAVWGAFYATGDLSYVDKVIAIVPFYNAKEGTVEFLAGKTALWSVAGNAIGHPAVLGHITRVAKNHPDNSVRAYLGAVLEALFNAYEKQRKKELEEEDKKTTTGVEARLWPGPAPVSL